MSRAVVTGATKAGRRSSRPCLPIRALIAQRLPPPNLAPGYHHRSHGSSWIASTANCVASAISCPVSGDRGELLDSAPVDDEPSTPEEEAAVQAAREELARSETVSLYEIRAE